MRGRTRTRSKGVGTAGRRGMWEAASWRRAAEGPVTWRWRCCTPRRDSSHSWLSVPATLHPGGRQLDARHQAAARRLPAPASTHQLDVVESWAPQDAHAGLAHHVLAGQHLQQRRLACEGGRRAMRGCTHRQAGGLAGQAMYLSGSRPLPLPPAASRRPAVRTCAIGSGEQATASRWQREAQVVNDARREGVREGERANHNWERVVLLARLHCGHGSQLRRVAGGHDVL